MTGENSPVWFSHREDRYDTELKGDYHVFHWTDNAEIWDWDNCTVSALKLLNNKIRVVVRSLHTVHSEYRKADVKIRYMLGFDVNNIQEPKTEDYHEPPNDNMKNKVYGRPKPRWVVQLDDDYWIWQWTQAGTKIESSNLYQVYLMIKNVLNTPVSDTNNIFKVEIQDDSRYIPVIYQPAIDSWKNFVREVHCHQMNDDEFEVTIIFNNEQLREHALLNSIYEWFRSLVYGRTIDVETFRIILKEGVPEHFKFAGIYSGENDIQQDDIHGDKPDGSGNVPTYKIKYYFVNKRHTIVFINTANHAMGEHDTNHRLWKWEYVTWEKDSAVAYGEKSRNQIDRSFKPKLKFW